MWLINCVVATDMNSVNKHMCAVGPVVCCVAPDCSSNRYEQLINCVLLAPDCSSNLYEQR